MVSRSEKTRSRFLTIERREVNIYATKEDEEEEEKQLYNWLKHTADRLLNE